jgi:hypothetical protein
MRGDRPPGAAGGEREPEGIVRAGGSSIDLARELTGSLPCAGCGYDLKSMSIRGVCPECATPVRATLLARIDPHAEQLQPITHPMLTSAGLLAWASAALAAGLLTWLLRGADVWAVALDRQTPPLHGAILLATVCIVVSGVGGLVLVRPHRGVPWWQRLAAIAGVLCTWGLAAVYWKLHAEYDPLRLRPYVFPDAMQAERSLLRLGASALLLGVIFGLRPNVRMLAARSLVMRMGRADRQTMIAIAAAVGLAMIGDGLQLVAANVRGVRTLFQHLGLFLIGIGSMLLTVGLVGIVLDAIRLVPVILRPPISMAQVLGDAPQAGSSQK